MKMNIKKGLAITTALASSLGLVSPAFAQTNVNPCPSATQFQGLCNLSANNIGGVIGAAVAFILVLAVLIALFFLIWGGIRWILSGGDKSKVEGARNTIIAAIIGLVIAFLAFFVLSLALSFFNISLTNLALPRIPGI